MYTSNYATIQNMKKRTVEEQADFAQFVPTCLPGAHRNVSSVVWSHRFPASAAYGVSKAGVAQPTRQLAADQSSRGVLVNAVAPGVIRTPMTEARIEGNPWYQSVMIDPTPVDRVGESEDVAGVVAFLCSPDAAFISGQVIPVDGGWLATRYLKPE